MPNMTPIESADAGIENSKTKTVVLGLIVGAVVLTMAVIAVVWWLLRGPSARDVVAGPAATEPIILSHDVTSAESRRKWGAEVPHGTQVLDQVTFVCDGALRTAGLRAPKH